MGKGFGRQRAEGIWAESRRDLDRVGEMNTSPVGERKAVETLKQRFRDLREEGSLSWLELGRGRLWVEREGL